jgi:hypothetical protein
LFFWNLNYSSNWAVRIEEERGKKVEDEANQEITATQQNNKCGIQEKIIEGTTIYLLVDQHRG